jgi:hypothetical protein
MAERPLVWHWQAAVLPQAWVAPAARRGLPAASLPHLVQTVAWVAPAVRRGLPAASLPHLVQTVAWVAPAARRGLPAAWRPHLVRTAAWVAPPARRGLPAAWRPHLVQAAAWAPQPVRMAVSRPARPVRAAERSPAASARWLGACRQSLAVSVSSLAVCCSFLAAWLRWAAPVGVAARPAWRGLRCCRLCLRLPLPRARRPLAPRGPERRCTSDSSVSVPPAALARSAISHRRSGKYRSAWRSTFRLSGRLALHAGKSLGPRPKWQCLNGKTRRAQEPSIGVMISDRHYNGEFARSDSEKEDCGHPIYRRPSPAGRTLPAEPNWFE